MLTQVATGFVTGLVEPFGVAFASDSKHAFVDSLFSPPRTATRPIVIRDDSGISVYSVSASGLTDQRIGTFSTGSLVGMALSSDGRDLVAANESGASFFSVSRIEQPKSLPSSWLLGSFTSKGKGAIEAAFSPDGDYVFVTLESSPEVAVLDSEAESHGFDHSDLIGYVPLGVAPVGMAISPNGHYLYATSEAVTANGGEGTLSTIDLTALSMIPLARSSRPYGLVVVRCGSLRHDPPSTSRPAEATTFSSSRPVTSCRPPHRRGSGLSKLANPR